MGLPWYEQIDSNVFGVMNYTLSALIGISSGNWSFIFTYSYSIPKALPGGGVEHIQEQLSVRSPFVLYRPEAA